MKKQVSIASAPHPPYPRKTYEEKFATSIVSIASAPHPPYPPYTSINLFHPGMIVSIASAPHPPYPPRADIELELLAEEFQSHLRLIHPIHFSMSPFVFLNWYVSIASAPHPPYPRKTYEEKFATSIVSIASAPHPPYPPLI